jgi:hypothetical protein
MSDLASLASKVGTAVDAPASPWARRVEHAVALYAAYRVVRALVTLGPLGVKKAVMGAVLKGGCEPRSPGPHRVCCDACPPHGKHWESHVYLYV